MSAVEMPATLPGALVVAPQLGRVSETFVARQIAGLRRLRPVVLTGTVEAALPPEADVARCVRPLRGNGWVEKSAHRVRRWWVGDPWRLAPATHAAFAATARASGAVVLLAHYGHSALAALPLAEQLGLPLVAHFHGHDATTMLGDASYVAQLGRAWPRLARVVVASRYLAGRLEGVGCPPSLLTVAPLGVPLPPPRPAPRGSPVTLVHLGRLVPGKGPELTLEAFAAAVARRPGLRLEIVGDGPRRRACERTVRRCGLEREVRFHGALPHEAAMGVLERCDVLVQHNVTAPDGWVEGFGLGLLEAQVRGVPVIGTTSGGVPEVVSDGDTGLLVSPGDVAAMTEAIVRLADDPSLRARLGDAGRARVNARFELEARSAALEDCLLEVAAASLSAMPRR